jgi:hypothetical protein
MAQGQTLLSKTSTALPIVKSAVLGTNMKVHWSKPVQVIDSFEEHDLAVFDRHSFSRLFLNTDSNPIGFLYGVQGFHPCVGIASPHPQFISYLGSLYARIEVVSLWRRESIRVLLAYSDRDCLSAHSFYPSL